MTDYGVQILKLYRRLSEPQKRAMILSAVLTACADENRKGVVK